MEWLIAIAMLCSEQAMFKQKDSEILQPNKKAMCQEAMIMCVKTKIKTLVKSTDVANCYLELAKTRM